MAQLIVNLKLTDNISPGLNKINKRVNVLIRSLDRLEKATSVFDTMAQKADKSFTLFEKGTERINKGVMKFKDNVYDAKKNVSALASELVNVRGGFNDFAQAMRDCNKEIYTLNRDMKSICRAVVQASQKLDSISASSKKVATAANTLNKSSSKTVSAFDLLKSGAKGVASAMTKVGGVAKTAGSLLGKAASGAKSLAVGFAGFAGKAVSAATGLFRVKEEAKDTAREMGGAANRIQKVITVLAGFSILKNAVSSWSGPLEKAISRIDTSTTFERKMKLITGSTDDATRALEALKDSTMGTPYALDTATMAVQNFVTRGMGTDDAVESVNIWMDAISAYGTGTSEELETVMDAIGKMRTKGTVEMEQLNRLFDVGLNPVQIYADVVGKTAAQVQSDLSNRKISTEDFLGVVEEAMREGTNGVTKVAGQAKEAATTWAATMDNMNAAIARGFQGLIESLDVLLKPLSASGVKGLFKGFGKMMESGLGKVSDFITNDLSPKMEGVMTKAREMYDSLFGENKSQEPSALKEIWDQFKASKPKVSFSLDLLDDGRVKESIDKSFAKLKDSAAPRIFKQILDVFRAVGNVVDALRPSLARLGASFLKVVSSFSNTFVPAGIDAIADGIESLADWVEFKLPKAIETVTPWLDDLLFGFMAFKSLDGIISLFSGFKDVLGGIFSAVGGTRGAILTLGGALVYTLFKGEDMGDTLGNMMDAFGKLKKALTPVTDAFRRMGSQLSDVVSRNFERLKDRLSMVRDSLDRTRDAAGKLGDNSTFGRLGQAIDKISDSLSQTLDWALQQATDSLGNFLDWLTTGPGGSFEGSPFDEFLNGFAEGVEWFDQDVKPILGSIKDNFSALVGPAGDVVSSLSGFVAEVGKIAFPYALEKINDSFAWMADRMPQASKNLSDWFDELTTGLDQARGEDGTIDWDSYFGINGVNRLADQLNTTKTRILDILNSVWEESKRLLGHIFDLFTDEDLDGQKNLDPVNQFFDQLNQTLQNADQNITPLFDRITEGFDAFISACEPLVEGIKRVIDVFTQFVLPPAWTVLVGTLQWIGDHGEGAAEVIKDIVVAILLFKLCNKVTSVLSSVSNGVSLLSGGISGVSSHITGFTSAITGGEGLVSALGALLPAGGWVTIVVGALAALAATMAYFYSTNSDFRKNWDDAWSMENGFAGGVWGLVSALSSACDVVREFGATWGAIYDMVSGQVGSLTSGWNALVEKIQNARDERLLQDLADKDPEAYRKMSAADKEDYLNKINEGDPGEGLTWKDKSAQRVSKYKTQGVMAKREKLALQDYRNTEAHGSALPKDFYERTLAQQAFTDWKEILTRDLEANKDDLERAMASATIEDKNKLLGLIESFELADPSKNLGNYVDKFQKLTDLLSDMGVNLNEAQGTLTGYERFVDKNLKITDNSKSYEKDDEKLIKKLRNRYGDDVVNRYGNMSSEDVFYNEFARAYAEDKESLAGAFSGLKSIVAGGTAPAALDQLVGDAGKTESATDKAVSNQEEFDKFKSEKEDEFVQRATSVSDEVTGNIVDGSVENLGRYKNESDRIISGVNQDVESVGDTATQTGNDIKAVSEEASRKVSDEAKTARAEVETEANALKSSMDETAVSTKDAMGEQLGQESGYEAGQNYATGFNEGVKSVADTGKGGSVDTLKKSGTKQAAKSAKKTIQPIGQNVADGLIRGVENRATAVKAAIDDLIESIKKLFIEGFEIHSPSRFTRYIGAMVARGYKEGWSQEKLNVYYDRAIEDLKRQMKAGTMDEMQWLRQYDQDVMIGILGRIAEVDDSMLKGKERTGFTYPLAGEVGEITKRQFNDPKAMSMSKGVDIEATQGTKVLNMLPGTVKELYEDYAGYGPGLSVDHGNGLETKYAGLRKSRVSKGAELINGRTLGRLGRIEEKGQPTGTFHFEVLKQGKNVNPLSYLADSRHYEAGAQNLYDRLRQAYRVQYGTYPEDFQAYTSSKYKEKADNRLLKVAGAAKEPEEGMGLMGRLQEWWNTGLNTETRYESGKEYFQQVLKRIGRPHNGDMVAFLSKWANAFSDFNPLKTGKTYSGVQTKGLFQLTDKAFSDFGQRSGRTSNIWNGEDNTLAALRFLDAFKREYRAFETDLNANKSEKVLSRLTLDNVVTDAFKHLTDFLSYYGYDYMGHLFGYKKRATNPDFYKKGGKAVEDADQYLGQNPFVSLYKDYKLANKIKFGLGGKAPLSKRLLQKAGFKLSGEMLSEAAMSQTMEHGAKEALWKKGHMVKKFSEGLTTPGPLFAAMLAYSLMKASNRMYDYGYTVEDTMLVGKGNYVDSKLYGMGVDYSGGVLNTETDDHMKSIRGTAFDTRQIKGYATGTSSAAKGLHWVGEQGPELMSFRGGETVIPADMSKSVAGIVNSLQNASYSGGTLTLGNGPVRINVDLSRIVDAPEGKTADNLIKGTSGTAGQTQNNTANDNRNYTVNSNNNIYITKEVDADRFLNEMERNMHKILSGGGSIMTGV